MIIVQWVRIFLEEAMSDGYNMSNRLNYQEGGTVSEMGVITQITIEDSKITVCCKFPPGDPNSEYIVIPLNSNVIKFHYGGVKQIGD